MIPFSSMLWRPCNLTSFSPYLTGPVDYGTCLFPVTRDPGSNPLGGCLCETGILQSALSDYIGDPNVIDHFCGLV